MLLFQKLFALCFSITFIRYDCLFVYGFCFYPSPCYKRARTQEPIMWPMYNAVGRYTLRLMGLLNFR